ncbi:zinc transporter ZIP1 [Halyomorpha halys]|uniref:zinc transporter ZIP1 n=1 Tax=Halyomorpha halys TaxID=286706 RepID=UPI0006D4C6FB|nr:zinc transporter ZIP1 [Halyomorpha halys]
MNSIYAKVLAVVVVTIGSYVCGLVPAILGLGSTYKKSILLSSTLCFGAGVLLSTSVVHILPDVRKDVHQWGELLLCAGFFLIYSVDVLLSPFLPKNEASSEEQDPLLPQESTRVYGSTSNCNESQISSQDNVVENQETKTKAWSCMNFGLLIAFTTHALLEGLVIGVQDSANGVLLLLGAVCSHKLLVAFCLGTELISGGRHWYSLIVPLSVFVLGSDIGIILGLIFEIDGSSLAKAIIPYIQAIAGGTLLYIALCEIIPREKARDLPRCASFFQIIGMFIGFSVMSALSILL